MAVHPELIATVTAMTATNSSVQAIAASSGRKLVAVAYINASTNTAVAMVSHGTSYATSTVVSGSRITTGQGTRDFHAIENDPDSMGLNVESGAFLRRLAGQPIVVLYTRKY